MAKRPRVKLKARKAPRPLFRHWAKVESRPFVDPCYN